MTRHASPLRSTAARQRGVSLIELLVALVIGSLLIIGAVTVFMQSRTTYRTNETAARLQEVARYALDTIEPDVRLAGFWGLTNRPDFVDNRGTPADPRQAVDPAANNCGVNFTVNAATPVDARDQRTANVYAGTHASTGGATGFNMPACPATTATNWSDVLIVRRASSDVAPLQAGRMQIQSSRIRATIFSDGAVPAMYDPAASETHNMVVHAYYVSEGAAINGVRQFSLRRKTLGAGPAIVDEEVISGVEDMQVQFGIDNAPRDGNVERYVNPGGVPAGARIASIRIWLRVVAEEREIGWINDTNFVYANQNYGRFNDDRRRVLVSKTIQIRNAPI
jgi:type IV pilus assembly protein PilW